MRPWGLALETLTRGGMRAEGKPDRANEELGGETERR